MKEPSLIIIGGFAGAGKTTLANRLSIEYSYPILSSDVINDVLRLMLQKSFHEISPTAHAVIWHLVRQQLNNGITLIVDTNMCSEKVWGNLDRLYKDIPGVKILPIILQCAPETHRNRIDERGLTNKEHLNLGGDSLEDVIFKYEFIEKLQRPDLIRVDANGRPDEVYATVKKLLQL